MHSCNLEFVSAVYKLYKVNLLTVKSTWILISNSHIIFFASLRAWHNFYGTACAYGMYHSVYNTNLAVSVLLAAPRRKCSFSPKLLRVKNPTVLNLRPLLQSKLLR